MRGRYSRNSRFCVLILLLLSSAFSSAQDSIQGRKPKAQLRREIQRSSATDSLVVSTNPNANDTLVALDSLTRIVYNDIENIAKGEKVDTLIPVVNVNVSADEALQMVKEKFVPDPKKALWLAIVFPGGGQIYNRKYWKLPLIYGGFLGCVYALSWNNMMYRDYSQAYIDIMDDDPNTRSYESFIPRGYNIDSNLSRIQDLFRRKKNYYRRYRDLSMFCMIGVYALSVIDAYVDAELSSFDISHDLSMKVRPSIIHDSNSVASTTHNPYATQSYGVRCSLNF